MRKFPFILFLGLLVAGTAAAPAKTPDGKPPSEETICDNEVGVAFGLCNAYCEAMDCDSPNHHASEEACKRVRQNFERRTNRPMPCEVSCPCPDHLPVLAQILSGEVTVQKCLFNELFVSLVLEDDSFVLLSTQPPVATCSYNFEPPIIQLTPAEAISCRDLLRLQCVSPE